MAWRFQISDIVYYSILQRASNSYPQMLESCQPTNMENSNEVTLAEIFHRDASDKNMFNSLNNARM